MSDEVYPLGILRFEIFVLLMYLLSNLTETAAGNMFATLYKNPNSIIFNSSLWIMVCSSLGEVIFTFILSFFSEMIISKWNVYIGIMMALTGFVVFCYMYKYHRFKTSFT